MAVRLMYTTPDAEVNMAYVARVSNPVSQDNTTVDNAVRLLRYCIRHGHWSVFEHAYMTVEVTTSLFVATQLLRHRSFMFQQFSQRYAAVADEFQRVELRMQDTKNRQNSTDDCPADVAEGFQRRIQDVLSQIKTLYTDMVSAGVAKECARAVLPQCTTTRLYMTGNCRNWIHYIQRRTDPATQREHRDVAVAIQAVFCNVFPTVSGALGW